MPGTLQKLHGGPDLSAGTSAIFILVPGIDTSPVPSWKSQSILRSLRDVAEKLGKIDTYLTWFDHGLGGPDILSWIQLHRSAKELVDGLFKILSTITAETCPVVIVGHSIGGILVKEALRQWNQRPLLSYTESRCIAGAVLLGTPHSLEPQRALEFCRRISLAFPSLRTIDANYAVELTESCKQFDDVDVPTFSIYEKLPTRLGRLKRKLIVDKELARFKLSPQQEEIWPAECSHRDLCHVEMTDLIDKALSNFIIGSVIEKRRHIARLTLMDAPPSPNSPLKPDVSTSQDQGWLFESPEQSPSTSAPSSLGPAAAGFHHGDQSAYLSRVLSSQPPQRRIEYNLPEKAELFFPREEILKPLEDIMMSSPTSWSSSMTSSEKVRAFALCGKGGLGKSAIAGHYVHKHKGRYDAIFWVNAEDVTKLFLDFRGISYELELVNETRTHDEFDCQNSFKLWLERQSYLDQFQRWKWLIVFDHVTDPQHLRGFWPTQGGGDILVTTECSMSSMNDFSGEVGIEIEPFNKTVAQEFLKRLTTEQVNKPDQLIYATEIVEMLGGSPLALVSLSALLKHDKLDDGWVKGFAQRRSISRPDLSGETLDQVTSVVDPLLERLRCSVSLMDVLSMMDPDGVEEQLLTDMAAKSTLEGFPKDDEMYLRAKSELIGSSLIIEHNSKKKIKIHRLYQVATRRKMEPSRFKEVFQAIIEVFSVLWPAMRMAERHNTRRWERVDLLLSHVRRLRQIHNESSDEELILSFKSSVSFATLLNDAGWCMYERGNYRGAQDFADQAREIGEHLDSDDTSIEPHVLPNLLSQVYYTLGAVAQITQSYEESLDFHTKMLLLRKSLKSHMTEGDALLAHAYNEIGNDFMTDDEHEIAIGFYRTSIKIYENLKIEKHMLALPLVNLGLALWLRAESGDHAEARKIVQQALSEQERAFGGADDGVTMKTGRLLYALGNIFFSQGLEDESLRLHERALVQFERTIGRNHNRTCDVKYKLADHYARRGDHSKAMYDGNPEPSSIYANLRRNTLNSALQALSYQPLFERERGRFLFKKAQIMRDVKEFHRPDQCERDLTDAANIYVKYRGSQVPIQDLTERHFDSLVMFWSR